MLPNINAEEIKIGGNVEVPQQPLYAEINAHLFYIVCKSPRERTAFPAFLKANSIELPNAKRFSDCLLRLPLFSNLSEKDIGFIAAKVKEFYE